MPGLLKESHTDKKRKRGDDKILEKSARRKSLTERPVEEAENIQQLEEQIHASQKHYNNIITLIKLARQEAVDRATSSSACLALCRVFCRLHAGGSLRLAKSASANETKIVDWLEQRQDDYVQVLSDLVRDPLSYSQGLALSLELLKAEVASKGDRAWRDGIFAKLMKVIRFLGSKHKAVQKFQDSYLHTHRDILYYTVENIAKQETTSKTDQRETDIFLLSALDSGANLHDTESFCQSAIGSTKKITSSLLEKQVQAAWLAVLSSRLEDRLRKLILGIMVQNIVPWFKNVEVLMDFLTDSFNVGGSTSLLALSGLFSLMQEKNLDYPEFYKKLYSLLDTDILHSKHRSRFFRLLNIFMASTHLPAALVASFIKRLSRLALHAPPAAIVAVVPWVYNMLKAHPTCTFMVHRELRSEEERADLEEYGHSDPFHMRERDPMETNAIESSLWELETLQAHFHPNVASVARILSEQFTKRSYNLDDFLDHSYNSLIDGELDKELKKTPVSEFDIPKKVFVGVNGDQGLESLLAQVLGQT